MKNKKIFQRILALTLGLCLCLCIFAGCANDNSDTTDTDNKTTPPEKPDDNGGNGDTPPDKPGENGNGNGGSAAPTSYSAVNTYTADATISDETISSVNTDENAILVATAGIKTVFENVKVNRTSASSTGGDNSSFYGIGAAILATSGTAYIKNSTISTNAKGGAGVFAYGDGVIYVKDTAITTELDTSGGIHAAGGGTLYAWDLTVTTQGESSAAIRSDRGGGTMVVNGGTYTSNGIGSPAVYCTAEIAVNNSTLVANGSEGICIEGLNSLRIFDCDLTANMADNSQNDTTWGVIVYQSMSGDSEVGNSTFQMVGGSLNVKNGGVIYTTNTESHILLSDVEISTADGCEFFLQCTGNNNQRGWGTSGSNGSDCTFTAIDQAMEGNVIWDSISTLDFYMTNGSTLNGAILDDETCAENGGNGYCNVYVDGTSTWTVTGDSTVTNLFCAGEIVDANGKTVTIQNSDGTIYVQGTSEFVVTVSGNYSSSVDLSGADAASSFADYEVALPDELK